MARCAAASPLNAFISLEPDRLRAPTGGAGAASDSDRCGVPLALKDNIDTADFPTLHRRLPAIVQFPRFTIAGGLIS